MNRRYILCDFVEGPVPGTAHSRTAEVKDTADPDVAGDLEAVMGPAQEFLAAGAERPADVRGLDPAELDEWKAYLTALVQIAGEHTAEVGDALEVMNASMGRMALAEAVEVLDAATDDAEAGLKKARADLKKSRERRETEVEAAPLARKQAEAESSSEATNQCGDERGNSEDC